MNSKLIHLKRNSWLINWGEGGGVIEGERRKWERANAR